MKTFQQTKRSGFERSLWRPLPLSAQALIWFMIVMMALPPSALACLCNSCECQNSTGGGTPPSSAPYQAPISGASSPTFAGSYEPVNLGRMSTYLWATDIEPVPVPGGLPDAALHFTRFYSSDMTAQNIPGDFPLGPNLTHNYNVKFVLNSGNLPGHFYVYTEQGTEVVFYGGNGVFENQSDGDSRLLNDGTNYVWQLANGTRYTFDSSNSNRLMSIVDVFTNTVTLSYNGDSKLTLAQDQFGRNIGFNYVGGSEPILSDVIDPFGKISSFYYDTNGVLTGFANMYQEGENLYTYQPGTALLTSVNGHSYVYDSVGKITSETNAAGATMAFNRDDVTHTVVVTNRNGKTYTDAFNGASRHTSRVDLGGTATYERPRRIA